MSDNNNEKEMELGEIVSSDVLSDSISEDDEDRNNNNINNNKNNDNSTKLTEEERIVILNYKIEKLKKKQRRENRKRREMEDEVGKLQKQLTSISTPTTPNESTTTTPPPLTVDPNRSVSFADPKDVEKTQEPPSLTAGESSIPIPLERQKSFGETLSRRQVNLIVLALCLGMLMAALDNTIIVVSLPEIVLELEGTQDQYNWPLISYLLASTAFAPSYGRLSDIFGRRTTYLFVMVTFLIGSILCGASSNMEMLIAVRAIQGIGGGGLMGLGFVVLGDVVPPRSRGKYSGVMGGMFALSSVLGPLVGGVLTDNASWRWCFYINIPIAIVAIIILFLGFKKNYKAVDSSFSDLDFTGTFLMVIAIVMLELGISWGGDPYEWDDPVILILIVVGAFLFIPFFFSQRDAKLPIMPLELFKKKNVILPAISGFFIGIYMFVCFTYLPLWFQEVRSYSATEAGLQMIALMGGLIIASMLSGGLMTRTGRYKIFPIIGTILLTISSPLFALFDWDSGQGTFIPILMLAGFGVGLTLQVLTVVAQNDVAQKDIAVATTFVNFFRTIGSSFGLAVFGTIFNAVVTDLSQSVPTSAEGVEIYQAFGAEGVSSYILSLAIRRCFIYFTPIVACAFFPMLFVEEKPLRTSFDDAPVAAH